MASTAANASWLRDEVEASGTRHCFQSLKAWWCETTDIVILNSPLLNRATGNVFRCITMCILTFLAFKEHGYLSQLAHTVKINLVAVLMQFAGLGLLLVGALASFLVTVRRRRETVGASWLYCFLIATSQHLLSGAVGGVISEEARILCILAVLLHCNIHPIPLLLVMVPMLFRMCQIFSFFAGFFPYIDTMWCGIILLLMFCAFTRDFTVRVKSICTGMILPPGNSGRHAGETGAPHESPLSGRSARSICWLMVLSIWVAWGSLLIEKASQKANLKSAYPDLFQKNLPTYIWLVPCLVVASVLMWRYAEYSSPWLADLILLICSCTPPAMIFADVIPIFDTLRSQPEPVAMDFMVHFQTWVHLMVFVAEQILVQAGCNPLVCICPCVLMPLHIFASHSISGDKLLFFPFKVGDMFFLLAVSWMIWISNTIDYINRYRAIREALQRAQENAASNQALLDSIVINPNSGVELQQFMPMDPAEPPTGVAVAVVRHAERADAAHALDDWGCSEDAVEFPSDPPITAEGRQQAKQLALDLKQQLMSVDVIISSPYLRCLQTAEILAEEFDVLVLLDGEVGEIMGPTAFESQPTTRRSWAKLNSKCRYGRIKAGRTLGKEPKWPETLKDARIRYAKRFLDYLKRSRHTRKSCIIVTHGHMLPVCASILPATHHLQITGVDYAAALLAICRNNGDLEDLETADGPGRRYVPICRRAASLDSAMKKEVRESTEPNGRSDMLQMQNALVQDARIKYWSVWLRGLRTSSPTFQNSSILRELQTRDTIGMSWQDIVQLLGILPAAHQTEESATSFHTDPRTMSSMAYFRNPTGMRSSPPSEKSAAPATNAVPPPPALQLNLSSSRLASRRRSTSKPVANGEEKAALL